MFRLGEVRDLMLQDQHKFKHPVMCPASAMSTNGKVMELESNYLNTILCNQHADRNNPCAVTDPVQEDTIGQERAVKEKQGGKKWFIISTPSTFPCPLPLSPFQSSPRVSCPSLILPLTSPPPPPHPPSPDSPLAQKLLQPFVHKLQHRQLHLQQLRQSSRKEKS